MELRVLKYFLIVAREENITRAAGQLHVTQPTLSRQLMQLEDELQVKLFRRSKHSVVLTEEGILLKRRAQELVSLAEKTKLEFSGKTAEISGEIAIGCGETLSMIDLAKRLGMFRKTNPNVHFDIFSGNADHIKEQIDNGILDMGLLAEPVDISRYDFIRMPRKEQWGVLLRTDTKLAKKQEISPEDLAHVPLLVSKRTLVQHELSNWFGCYFDQLEIASTYNLIYNAAMMVQNHLGAALCLRLKCNYDGLTFRPLSPKLETGSVLVWKKDQALTPAMMQFIKEVRYALIS